MSATRILLLPGWQNSGPGHWRTRWEALHGFERLQQDDWWWPRRGDWMARLEDALLDDPRPTVLGADDPFSDAARCPQTAADWGCEIVSLGVAGHVNADSGRGDWPKDLDLLRALLRRADLPTHLPGDSRHA